MSLPGRLARCRFAHVGLLTIVSLGATVQANADDLAPDQPVFRLGVASPTSNKPQSKLWFAHDSWWAWLPNRQGSSVWRRTKSGWRRQESLDNALRDVPGRADVWQEGESVRAVLVDRRQLIVADLRFADDSDSYALAGAPTRFKVVGGGNNDSIETATIAHDGSGRWWIAYPWNGRMWIRATLADDDDTWSEPFALSDVTAPDDLCALVRLPGAVGLAWSNQANETMNFRLHRDGAEIANWEKTEVIDRGNRTADDHINAKVSPDGTLYMATKNSVDRVGEPQLVLRIRRPNGTWENWPYACRTNSEEPSRPIVLLGGSPSVLLLLHTLYRRTPDSPRKNDRNTIEWQSVTLDHLGAATLNVPSQTLLAPTPSLNNVTGCKQILPAQAPWIVLASDSQGNVYEGRLDLAMRRAGLLATPAE
jgi:hypothetical protein